MYYCVHVWSCVHVGAYLCVYAGVFVCVLCMSRYICVCAQVCVSRFGVYERIYCICVCVCVSVCVSVCVRVASLAVFLACEQGRVSGLK